MLDTLQQLAAKYLFCEITDELVTAYESLSLHEQQARRNASVIRDFAEKFKIFSFDSIREFLFNKKKEGKSDKTIANAKSSLSAFAVFLRRQGLLSTNPCRDVELPSLEELPPIILTRAEAATAISIATGLGCAGQVVIALFAGLRASEICRLKWSDIDIERKGIIVRKSKGKRFRVVPLCRRVAAMLEKQRTLTGQYKYIFPQLRRRQSTGEWRLIADAPRSIEYMMTVIVPIRNAIPTLRDMPPKQTGRGWHAFRHTFASWAVAANVSIYKLSRWMGHKDVRTTQRYARLLQQYDPEIERISRVRLTSPRIGVGKYDDE